MINKISNANNRIKSNLNFMAKPPKTNLNIKKPINVDEFFKNPENIKKIEENKKYSEEITNYVAENSIISEKVMNTPFGPAPGIEW